MTGGQALLIVNAKGGTAKGRADAAAGELRRHGFAVEQVIPDDPATISDLIRDRGPEADRIILGGGDGTFSRSAGALMETGKPVGFLPMGTANDLARTLALPADPVEAARIAAGKHSRRIDLGEINGRAFFNVASIGFSVRVAAHHTGERKKRLKMLSYPLSWLDAQREMEPFRVTVRYGRRKRRFRSTMVAIGNGVHFGGGLMIADNAAIDDGWLDMFYVRPLGPLGMLGLLPFLKLGAIRRRQDVRVIRAREIELDARPQQDFNVDGELVESTPARFRVLRHALEVFVPEPR